jgi:GDPmannose 4,6-dehydratase
VIVRVNPAFYRPADVELLVGDAGKARRLLGWECKIEFRLLAAMMAEADARRVRDAATETVVPRSDRRDKPRALSVAGGD